jgi:hypothetical protein
MAITIPLVGAVPTLLPEEIEVGGAHLDDQVGQVVEGQAWVQVYGGHGHGLQTFKAQVGLVAGECSTSALVYGLHRLYRIKSRQDHETVHVVCRYETGTNGGDLRVTYVEGASDWDVALPGGGVGEDEAALAIDVPDDTWCTFEVYLRATAGGTEYVGLLSFEIVDEDLGAL